MTEAEAILEPKIEKYTVKLETTQKCINVTISARDDDDIIAASDLAIKGFMYTKNRNWNL